MSSNKGKEPKQLGGKKKRKNKKKKQEDSTPMKPSGNPVGRKKPDHPCFICNEDHYTQNCPHRAEVTKFLKTSSTSAVLNDPFPTWKPIWLLAIMLLHPKCLCYPSLNKKMML